LTKFPVLDDADDVLAAIRLGWAMAETRGRNRPNAPPGENARLPAEGDDRALPLRVERTSTELRIEAQVLVLGLAKQLHVDTATDGTSFGAALDEKARLLYHVRAQKAARALAAAARLLSQPAPARADALTVLNNAVKAQELVMVARRQAVATAQQALDAAKQRETAVAGQPANAAAASRAVSAATTTLQEEQTASDGEAAGLQALTQAVSALEAADPEAAVRDASSIIGQVQQNIADSSSAPW
jgi:hypothetical protein